VEPRPVDEERHLPEAGSARWEEWWHFDFHTGDSRLGGYVRLGLWPQHGRAWFWAALVGDQRPLVTVVDHELRLPRAPGLDLRAESLWCSLTCETPLQHWSVGLEAFGVALDDPGEAFRSGRGDRTAFGLDLEWETVGGAADHPHPEGYHLPCLVHGEVLVGPEVIAFDGWGGRSHAWGDGWGGNWSPANESRCTTSGRGDDGVTWHGYAPGGEALLGADGLARPGRLAVEGEGGITVEPVHHAPVQVIGPDGGTHRLARSLCRYVAHDGRRGAGWSEWHQPPTSP
jgi:hypothetical protein